MSGESDIMLGNITFTYLNADAPAIRDISLEVEAGSVTAILGPVGAGKSTLLRILNRLIPTVIPGRLQGEVVVAGKTARGSDVAQMSRYVNLVFDDPSLQIVGLTVEEDVAFGPANLGLPRDEIWQRVREALGKTRLVGFEKRNPRTLSGGEQQLLAMAGVLAMRPRVIALDEPSAMLDPLGKTQVLEAVRELNRRYGTTVVVADSGSDVEAVLEFADRAVLMHRGQVVADGTPQEVFSRRDVVEKTQMKPPQVTRLAWEVGWRLGGSGSSEVPVTLEEARSLLAEHLANSRLVPSDAGTEERIPSGARQRSPEPAIVVEDLRHAFPGDPPVQALGGISLTIGKGEFVALVGQNGSGKTTLAYHLVGVMKPTNADARIMVDGVDVVHAPLSETIRHVNYLFQNPANQLFCDTVWEEVAYGPRRLGLNEEEVRARVADALRTAGLEGYEDMPTLGMTRSMEALVSFAAVLAMEPQVIIADEPTGGLDFASGTRIMEALRYLNREGRTILVITHDMEVVAAYASRVVVLNKGRILEDGAPAEVFRRPDLLREACLSPPQITQLAQSFGEYGFPGSVLSVEEMAAILRDRLGRELR